VAATKNGEWAAYGKADGTINIRQRKGKAEDGSLSYFSVQNWDTEQLHQGPVTALAFTPDGRYLISGGLPDRKLRPELAKASLIIWDVATRKPFHQEQSREPIFDRLEISPDGRKLLTAGAADHFVRVWQLPQGICPALPAHDE
jgi:WD40 repeat protein